MQIVFFGLDKDKEEMFKVGLSGAEITFSPEKLSKANAKNYALAEAVCVFVDSTLDQAALEAMPMLKFIATRSTGFDHINMDYAKQKGIKVASVPGYGAHTVSEFAFGLLLALSRRIVRANDHERKTLDYDYQPEFQGFDLAGKTLGVVGTGRIGKNVIKIARGFGMNVIACDHFPDAAFARENGFSYKKLDELVASADIITLHAPYIKENHHLLSAERIATMKKGAYVINTARGELLDTKALLEALKENKLGGVGLDVFENEQELKAKNGPYFDLYKELVELSNVVITPHMAFFTGEAVGEILKITLDNLRAYISGKPINLVQ